MRTEGWLKEMKQKQVFYSQPEPRTRVDPQHQKKNGRYVEPLRSKKATNPTSFLAHFPRSYFTFYPTLSHLLWWNWTRSMYHQLIFHSPIVKDQVCRWRKLLIRRGLHLEYLTCILSLRHIWNSSIPFDIYDTVSRSYTYAWMVHGWKATWSTC